jgi:hypothetical protein
MANTLLTIDMITREAARVLHGSSAFLKGVNKAYDSSFAKTGAKIGDTLRVRLPNQYTVRTTRVMDVQNTVNQSVSLPITQIAGTDMNFTSAELALDLDDFSENIIKPAMSVIAAHIDYTALSMTYDVANSVGTPGTTPASINVWSDAMAKLDDNLAPRDGNRMIITSPTAMAKTMQGEKGLFNPSSLISDQYRNGVLYEAIGAKWAMDQNIRNLTTGTNTNRTTTCDLAGAVSTGASTLSIDGLSGATVTIKQGEVFTIAGVYDVNPETKQALPTLKQFVVTADATGSGSAITNLAISPTIYGPTSGGLQNVSALPTTGDDLVFYGTTASTVYPQSLVFHKDAFTFATADLPMPRAAQMASRQVLDGISMRIWQGDDIVNDQFPVRVDVLYGFVAVRPQLACRVWG